jgi:hypothetical protein
MLTLRISMSESDGGLTPPLFCCRGSCRPKVPSNATCSTLPTLRRI